jgi:hypothetical protein
VTDYLNHRVLIWSSVPTSNGQPADLVLGQTDMASAVNGTAANLLRYPYGAHSDGTRLVVADFYNNRVLL